MIHVYVVMKNVEYEDESRSMKPIVIHICKDGTFTYRDASKKERVFNGVALPVLAVDTVEEAEVLQIRFCRKQYESHPLMPGKPWYRLNEFSGDVDDLPKVSKMLQEAYDKMKGKE